MRILVAEDSLAIGRVIQFNLEQAGFEVTHAASGEAAWELLQEEDFDLLVTDFQMPGLTGGDICDRLRQEVRLASLPVVMLTAKGLEIDLEHYRERLGVRAVLTKPFSPRQLIQVVQESLAAVSRQEDID